MNGLTLYKALVSATAKNVDDLKKEKEKIESFAEMLSELIDNIVCVLDCDYENTSVFEKDFAKKTNSKQEDVRDLKNIALYSFDYIDSKTKLIENLTSKINNNSSKENISDLTSSVKELISHFEYGGWKPIDTVPYSTMSILLTDGVHIWASYFGFDDFTEWEIDGIPTPPTHWCPFPEPPKLGKKHASA